MKIGSLEFGIIKFAEDYNPGLALHYSKSSCNCHIWEWYKFYITWLSKECKDVD